MTVPGSSLQECRAEAERLANGGDPPRAYDVATAALTQWPGDVRLRQLQALALAKSGAPEPAAALLHRLADEGAADEETLGILARTHQDAWSQESDPARRVQHLRRASDAYADGCLRTGGYWTGINAATCARLLDETEAAQRLAGPFALSASPSWTAWSARPSGAEKRVGRSQTPGSATTRWPPSVRRRWPRSRVYGSGRSSLPPWTDAPASWRAALAASSPRHSPRLSSVRS